MRCCLSRLFVTSLAILIGVVSGSTSLGEVEPPSVDLVPAFPHLTFKRPIQVLPAPGEHDALYVVEQAGRVLRVDKDEHTTTTMTFMDITDRVYRKHNEEGLLSFAFHPEYETNREVYVCYSAKGPRRGVLSRFTVGRDGRVDDVTEQVLLEVAQPFGNHNGATVLFGPDRMLYVSYGDGGSANDPLAHGQNLETLLGTIIRIDVDQRQSEHPYVVPRDNPFVGDSNARSEIWAYGLRNVWRMSFDRETGALWAGDVGQNAYEEIDLIVKGGNYGWHPREGKHPGPRDEDMEPAHPFIDPVVEYRRHEGLSVTGGYVYRGDRFPSLRGWYLYADYASGNMWALNADDADNAKAFLVHARRGLNVSSFGEDHDGTIYVCSFEGNPKKPGKIFRIEPKVTTTNRDGAGR